MHLFIRGSLVVKKGQNFVYVNIEYPTLIEPIKFDNIPLNKRTREAKIGNLHPSIEIPNNGSDTQWTLCLEDV